MRRWIMLFLVGAAGVFALRTFGDRPENDAAPREPHPGAAPPKSEHVARAPSTSGERTALLPQPGTAPEPDPAPPVIVTAQPLPRSLLTRNLQGIADSFLTERPRVTDLLGLVEDLASLAVVDPGSVTVRRSDEGDLLFARGPLAIGDLSGRFLIDQDGHSVQFDIPLDDGQWSRCALQITFQEGESGARGCYASVRFHPKEGEAPANHQGETLVGWSVGTAPERGAIARPLTTALDGGGSGRVQPQEFPWASSYTKGFDAWLRTLNACTSR